LAVRCSDGDNAITICRLLAAGIPVVVTGRNSDGCTFLTNRRYCVSEGPTACSRSAKAQVQNPRPIRIIRNPWNRQADRPAHPIGDVGHETAALTQNPHRENAGVGGDPGDAHAIVCDGCNSAGYVRSMPAAVSGGTPISWIGRIRISAIAIVRCRDIRNKIEAGEDVRGKIGMWAKPSVDHCNYHTVSASILPRWSQIYSNSCLVVVPLLG
jgi:hypothetical protein